MKHIVVLWRGNWSRTIGPMPKNEADALARLHDGKDGLTAQSEPLHTPAQFKADPQLPVTIR